MLHVPYLSKPLHSRCCVSSLHCGTAEDIIHQLSKDAVKLLKNMKLTLAKELEEISPAVYKDIITALKSAQPNIIIETTPHEQFKQQTANSRAVIRTGECTPYVNVILHSGVSF